jgi:hypothetical protein
MQEHFMRNIFFIYLTFLQRQLQHSTNDWFRFEQHGIAKEEKE